MDLGSFDEVELLGRAMGAALLVSCKTVSSQERRVVFFSFLILTLRVLEGMMRECEDRMIRGKSGMVKETMS